jgi:hypothetical protein
MAYIFVWLAICIVALWLYLNLIFWFKISDGGLWGVFCFMMTGLALPPLVFMWLLGIPH